MLTVLLGLCILVDMHAAYVGCSSYYSNWPVDHNSSASDRRVTTADQPTLTALDRPLLHARPQATGQALVSGTGFHVGAPPQFHHLSGAAQMANGAPDIKANVSSDESFCSSDDQPPSKNSSSVDGFVAPLPLPSCHPRCPPSVVDAGGQPFGPLPTFAGYPFPVLPPASTSGLAPPTPHGYSFTLGTTSRGRLQRQNGTKSATKLVSPSRTRSHVGLYSIYSSCILMTN